MRDSHLKAHLPISVQAGVFIRRERDKEKKEIRREAVDMQAVSLLVLMWIFNDSILELVSAAKFLQLGNPCPPKLWSRLFFVQAETGTAGACNMLTKKLSVCEFFLSVC